MNHVHHSHISTMIILFFATLIRLLLILLTPPSHACCQKTKTNNATPKVKNDPHFGNQTLLPTVSQREKISPHLDFFKVTFYFLRLYHGKSPLDHHLGRYLFLFPSILSTSKYMFFTKSRILGGFGPYCYDGHAYFDGMFWPQVLVPWKGALKTVKRLTTSKKRHKSNEDSKFQAAAELKRLWLDIAIVTCYFMWVIIGPSIYLTMSGSGSPTKGRKIQTDNDQRTRNVVV